MADRDLQYYINRRRNLNSRISEELLERAEINGKLSRLRDAKRYVIAVKDSVGDIRSRTSKSNSVSRLELEWKGEKYDAYRDLLGNEVKTSFSNYYNGVDNVLDAICDKITELENQLYNKNILIGGLRSSLNSIGNAIEKLLN